MPKVRVTVVEAAPPPGGRSLLVPVPPETHFQELAALTLSDRCQARSRTDSRHCQEILEISAWRRNGFAVDYTFIARPPQRPATARPETTTAALAVRRAVEETAGRFSYGQHSEWQPGGGTACDLLTGNCIDIHGYLLAALAAADISAAYHAGYHFAANGAEADGMHCWVSACVDGDWQDWDIAHHLKFGLGPILPGLNPAGGVRVAVSRGRDLRFDTAFGPVSLGHLAQPVWVMADGSVRKAQSRVTLGD